MDSASGPSQPNHQGTAPRRKKTQWKKLDWTDEEVIRADKRGSSATVVKLPRYELPQPQKIKYLLTFKVVLQLPF